MTNTNEYLLRILATYAPCKAMLKDRGVHLVGVNFGENEIIYAYLSEDGNYDYDAIPEFDSDIANCKPILTPLSGITDEHKEKASMLIYGGHYGIKNKWLFLPSAIGLRVQQILIGDRADEGKPVSSAAIDYLRSKSYDCGFMEIPSLIEAGLAISSQGDPKLFIEWNEATDSLKITAEKKDEKDTER